MTEKSKLIIHCQLSDDLEQLFLSELNETHKKTSELLRSIISEHYQFKNNPLSFLFAQPQMKELLSLKAKTELIEAQEKAKQETLRLKDKQKKDAYIDRALSHSPKVDYGASEGSIVTSDNAEQIADGFFIGDK